MIAPVSGRRQASTKTVHSDVACCESRDSEIGSLYAYQFIETADTKRFHMGRGKGELCEAGDHFPDHMRAVVAGSPSQE